MPASTLLCRQSVRRCIAGRACAVTLGNFDGLHLGHQQLLRAVAEEKKRLGPGACSVLVSFYPHPGVVLGKAPRLPQITTSRQKLRFMSEFGIDIFHAIRFTKEFASLTAQRFIEEILIQRLNTRTLVIGPDARVGHNREGTPEFIKAALGSLGRSCREIPFLAESGEVISSRRIRSLIEGGELQIAEKMLGRPFTYASTVIAGDQRGRQIGFPTANLHVNRQVLPRPGVYAGFAEVPQGVFKFVGNIGMRPTFSGKGLQLEAHLLDFPGDSLYGGHMALQFKARLRDEIRFAGIEELRAQIVNDIANARRMLS